MYIKPLGRGERPKSVYWAPLVYETDNSKFKRGKFLKESLLLKQNDNKIWVLTHTKNYGHCTMYYFYDFEEAADKFNKIVEWYENDKSYPYPIDVKFEGVYNAG